MNSDFAKFPRTPHLLWLGDVPARGDKVLSRVDAESFLRGRVLVEEKVDGANLGISFDSHGALLAQNRGAFIERGTRGEFAAVWSWLHEHEPSLFDVLGDRLILFGEWCYARHSIQYTLLPDFFLAFDVFDKRERQFISALRRDEIVGTLALCSVPKVGDGVFSPEEIPHLIGASSLYDGPMEGIYLRRDSADRILQRAKVVRAEFAGQIGEHWSKKNIVLNRLKCSKR